MSDPGLDLVIALKSENAALHARIRQLEEALRAAGRGRWLEAETLSGLALFSM